LHLSPGAIPPENCLLGRVLGQSGFGTIYIAWYQKLEMKLALKKYSPLGMAAKTRGSIEIGNNSSKIKEQLTFGLQLRAHCQQRRRFRLRPCLRRWFWSPPRFESEA
jgi:serine/threonine protein kinase